MQNPLKARQLNLFHFQDQVFLQLLANFQRKVLSRLFISLSLNSSSVTITGHFLVLRQIAEENNRRSKNLLNLA